MKYLVLSILSIGILSLTSCKKENPQLGDAPLDEDAVPLKGRRGRGTRQ